MVIVTGDSRDGGRISVCVHSPSKSLSQGDNSSVVKRQSMFLINNNSLNQKTVLGGTCFTVSLSGVHPHQPVNRFSFRLTADVQPNVRAAFQKLSSHGKHDTKTSLTSSIGFNQI